MDADTTLTAVLAGREQAVARLRAIADRLAALPQPRVSEALVWLQPGLDALERQAALVLPPSGHVSPTVPAATPPSGPSEKVVSGLLGIAGTILGAMLTLLTIGYVEGQKNFEQRRAETVRAYMEAAWGGNSRKHRLAHTRALSLVSVYATEEVLRAIRDYNVSGCASRSDEPCRQQWAAVVNAFRDMLGEPAVADITVTEALWGK